MIDTTTKRLGGPVAYMIEIKRVEIGAKTCTARVQIAPSAPTVTSQDLEATTRVYRLLPHIIEHSCIGDTGELFRDCMGDTEIAHLLEHVTVELLALTGKAGEITSGRTYIDPKDERQADVTVSCTDDVLTVSALQSAAWILNWAYTGGKDPKPDIEAMVAGLCGLIDSIGDAPAQSYAEKVQQEREAELAKKRDAALSEALAEREELARLAREAAEAEAAARAAAERQAAAIAAAQAATIDVPVVGEAVDVVAQKPQGDVVPLEEPLVDIADLPAKEEASAEAIEPEAEAEAEGVLASEPEPEEESAPEEVLEFVQAYDLDDLSPEAIQAAVDALSVLELNIEVQEPEETQTVYAAAPVITDNYPEQDEFVEPVEEPQGFGAKFLSMFHNPLAAQKSDAESYWDNVPVADFEPIEDELQPQNELVETAELEESTDAKDNESEVGPEPESVQEQVEPIEQEAALEEAPVSPSATATVVIPQVNDALAQETQEVVEAEAEPEIEAEAEPVSEIELDEEALPEPEPTAVVEEVEAVSEPDEQPEAATLDELEAIEPEPVLVESEEVDSAEPDSAESETVEAEKEVAEDSTPELSEEESFMQRLETIPAPRRVR